MASGERVDASLGAHYATAESDRLPLTPEPRPSRRRRVFGTKQGANGPVNGACSPLLGRLEWNDATKQAESHLHPGNGQVHHDPGGCRVFPDARRNKQQPKTNRLPAALSLALFGVTGPVVQESGKVCARAHGCDQARRPRSGDRPSEGCLSISRRIARAQGLVRRLRRHDMGCCTETTSSGAPAPERHAERVRRRRGGPVSVHDVRLSPGVPRMDDRQAGTRRACGRDQARRCAHSGA